MSAQVDPADSLESPPAPPESTVTAPEIPVAVTVSDTLLPRPLAPVRRMFEVGNEAVTDGRQILELASSSVGEAFAARPGVYLMRRGWHGLPQYLSIRGAGAGEIAYLIDGVPFSDNQIEVLDLNWLPLAGVEEVTVTKGGLSSIQGSGAIGGVLDVTPVGSMPDFPESKITAWWGSFDGRAVSLRFNRRITHRLGIMGTYENLGSGGWTANSSSERDKFFGKVTALLGAGTQFELAGCTYRGGIEWPDSCPTFFSTSSADQQNDRDFFKASVLSGGDRRVYIHYYRLRSSESFSSAEAAYTRDGTLNGIEAGMSWLAADSALTSLGAGYKIRRIDDSSLGNRSSNDIYASALKELRFERWRLQGSISLAKNSDFDAETGLGLVARFAPWRGVHLFSKLDRSYRFPSLLVLYHTGKDEPADAAIQAETSLGAELGALVGKGPVSVTVSVYRRSTDGLAVFRTDDDCATYLDPSTEIDVTGLEGSVDLCLRPWFEAGVSYDIRREDLNTGEGRTCIPDEVMAFRAAVSRKLSQHVSIGITLTGEYVEPVEIGARMMPCESEPACIRNAELPAYTVATFNAHVDIDRGMVFFKIENLANEEIRTGWGLPALPKRSYEFGVSVLLVD